MTHVRQTIEQCWAPMEQIFIVHSITVNLSVQIILLFEMKIQEIVKINQYR